MRFLSSPLSLENFKIRNFLRSSFFVLLFLGSLSVQISGQIACCGPLVSTGGNCEQAGFKGAYLYNPQSGNATLTGISTVFPLPNLTHCWSLFLELDGELIPIPGTNQTSVNYSLDGKLDRGCYVLRHCTNLGGVSTWCDWKFCVDYTAPGDECDNLCCVLTVYGLFSDPGTWEWGDQTNTQTHPGPWHTYHNVNTYEVNPINIRKGTLLLFPIQVIDGIFVGEDCSITSITVQENKLLPGQLLFPHGGVVGQSANENISVDGTLEIDKGFSFFENDFCMKPGSRLLVSTGRKVSITRSYLHDQQCSDNICNNSCGSWFGIEQYSSNADGTDLNIENSRISGAYNGLYSNGTTIGTNQVSLKSVFFDRDFLGMRLEFPTVITTFEGNQFGLSQTPVSDPIAMWPLFTDVCPWVSKINKPDNHTPFAGIYIKEPKKVVLDLSNASGINTFQNLANGIYSENASIIVRNCQMINMVCGYFPEVDNNFDDGYGIFMKSTRSRILDQVGFGENSPIASFAGCRTGIYLDARGNANYGVRIRENNTFALHNGVFLRFAANAGLRADETHFVSANTISYGIQTCQGDNSAYGIYTQLPRLNTASIEVSDNLVIADGAPPPFQHYGIRLAGTSPNDAGTARARLLRNEIIRGQRSISTINFSNALIENNECTDFTDFGIHSQSSTHNIIASNTTTSAPQGTNSGVRLVSSILNRVLCNTTNNSQYGLHLQSSCNDASITCNSFRNHNDIGVFYSNNPLAGLQRPGDINPGNTWVGDYTTPRLHARHVGAINTNLNIYFSGEGVFNVEPQNGWFLDPSSSINCVCGEPNDFSPSGDLTGLERNLLDGDVPATGLEAFNSELDLYLRLKRETSLQDQHAQSLDFLQAAQDKSVGKLAEVMYQMGRQPELHTIAEFTQIMQRLDAIEARLLELNNELRAGALMTDQEIERTSLSAETEQLQAEADQLAALHYADKVASASDLLQELKKVQAVDAWEANTKALLEIVLSSSYQGKDFSGIQLDVLRQIAAECVFEGGRPVSTAQSIIEAYEGVLIDNPCDVKETGERTENPPMAAGKLRIAPNPTRSEAWVDLSEIAAVSLHVYRLDGSVQFAQESLENLSTLQIKTQDWKPGIYFVKVHDAMGSTRTSLLSVIK